MDRGFQLGEDHEAFIDEAVLEGEGGEGGPARSRPSTFRHPEPGSGSIFEPHRGAQEGS